MDQHDPSAHKLIVTAIDASGHQVQTDVREEPDTAPPAVSSSSPVEDADLTYIHAVTGSVSDLDLLGYTLELRRVGDASFTYSFDGKTTWIAPFE